MRDRGSVGALQRRHRGRLAGGAGPGPAAVPAQHRAGRAADPAVQRRDRADAGPGAAQRGRAAARCGRAASRLGRAARSGSGVARAVLARPLADRGHHLGGSARPGGAGPDASPWARPSSSGLASSSAAVRLGVTAAVDAGVPAGVLRPTEVLAPEARAEEVAGRLADIEGVAAIVVPASEGWRVEGTALLQVWSSDDPASDAGRATLERVRADGRRRPGPGRGRQPCRGRRLRHRGLRRRGLDRARRSYWSPSCSSPARCARCGYRSRRWCSMSSRSRRRTA